MSHANEQEQEQQDSASTVPSIRMVIQRYRFARILLEESHVVSVGQPSSSLLANDDANNTKKEATLGLLVYISFSALASKKKVEQAGKTILNMPVGTLGAWGDGSGVKNMLQLLTARSTTLKTSDAPTEAANNETSSSDNNSPLSIILVPQANLIAKIKKNGKSIQYRDQIAKEQGRELYAYFCKTVQDLLLDHHAVCKGDKPANGGSSKNKSNNNNNNATPDPSIPPDQLFRRRTSEFATFDEATHLPLTTIDGESVTKSARKRMQKQYDAHVKRHEKWSSKNQQQETNKPGGTEEEDANPSKPKLDETKKLEVPSLDPSFLQLVTGTFGARQGIELQSDMGPFCHVVEI